MNMIEQLKKHEGLKLKPYHCTSGKLTIGYGRNIEDIGITEDEAETLLAGDVQNVKAQLIRYMPWYLKMAAPRRAVVENMAFNLGVGGFLKFKKMIAAMQAENYKQAAIEMLDSRWARQVKGRAGELSQQMITGEWQ